MFPAKRDVEAMPANLLFPDAYERTKRMIVLDFLTLGAILVAGVILAAMINLAIAPAP